MKYVKFDKEVISVPNNAAFGISNDGNGGYFLYLSLLKPQMKPNYPPYDLKERPSVEDIVRYERYTTFGEADKRLGELFDLLNK